MNCLPTDLETIVFKYQHNLNMKEVNVELMKSFFICKCCDISQKTIMKSEYESYCKDCNMDYLLLEQYERMLDREYEGNEFDIVQDIIESLSLNIKINLLSHMKDVEQVILETDYNVIMHFMTSYLE